MTRRGNREETGPKTLIGKERSVRAMGMKISILYLGKMEFPKFRLVDWKDEGAMVQSRRSPS